MEVNLQLESVQQVPLPTSASANLLLVSTDIKYKNPKTHQQRCGRPLSSRFDSPVIDIRFLSSFAALLPTSWNTLLYKGAFKSINSW